MFYFPTNLLSSKGEEVKEGNGPVVMPRTRRNIDNAKKQQQVLKFVAVKVLIYTGGMNYLYSGMKDGGA
jgi:hypothetical protein